MPSNRLARDKGRTNWAYHELFEGIRPSIPGLQPAQFLPVAAVDKSHDDDPIVLLPGTVVGRAGVAQIGSLPVAINAARPLVPACPAAYTITYSAFDTADAEFGGTIDIDGDGTGIAADTNASTTTLGPIKPIGIVPQPVYSPLLPVRFNNYDRNMAVSPFLVQQQAILIPAITAAELLIEPGDDVFCDFTASPDYEPTDLANSTPGRLQNAAGAAAVALPGTSEANIEAALAAMSEYKIGKCIDKFPIAQQTSTSAGQTYRAALGATNVNTASVSALWGFSSMRLVQTVPGLGLAGSGTEGVPGYLTQSVADANGYFWGLVIVVQIA